MHIRFAQVNEVKEGISHFVSSVNFCSYTAGGQSGDHSHAVTLYLYCDTDLAEHTKQVEAICLPKLREEATTIAEQRITKGRQQGMQQELRESILEVLKIRFGECPYLITEGISLIADREKLRSLHQWAVKSETLEDFKRELSVLNRRTLVD